jgi:hypothetical protein
MIPVEVKPIHYNKPQLRTMAINANETYVVAGRFTGKSVGILAPHDARCFQLMPRGCGMMIGSNFRKMMTDLIAPYVAGLEKIGLQRNVDFVIGQSDIPKKKGWKDPYIAPEKEARKFFLHTRWGSGTRFASQDRRVTMVGTEVDWIKGDEAKTLNYERFKKEIIPTNRGRENLWSHLPEHHSIMFCTDKLFDRKGGDWIMNMRHRVDEKLIEMIMQLQCAITKIEDAYLDQIIPVDVFKQLTEYRKVLAEAQCYAVAFIEADSLDNIHAIGWKTLMRVKANLTPAEFDVAILNRDKVKMDGGFYPNLDYEQHGYDATDYSRTDNLNYDFEKVKEYNCLDDKDCLLNQDLEISIDWGGHMNGLVVIQGNDIELRAINSLYVKPPDTYKDLARNFCNYYRYHKTKAVDVWYDPSGNNARADSAHTYAEEFATILREYGWAVNIKNTILTNPFHHDKHLLWQLILEEKDLRFHKFRMNRITCENVFTSMLNAPIKTGRSGFEKDKSSERKDSGTLPEHATHFSDMVDLIVWGKYSSYMEGSAPSFSAGSIG